MSSSTTATLVDTPRVCLDGLDDHALLDLAGQVVGRLGARTLDASLDDDRLTNHVERLHRLEGMVHGEKLRRIGELDARRGHMTGGASATASLFAARLGLTRGEAKAQAATAYALTQLPQTAARLAAGEIGAGQAQVAARALEDLDRLHDQQEAAGDPAEGGLDGEGPEDGDGGDGAEGQTSERERARAELDELVAGQGAGQDRRRLRDTIDGWAHRSGSDRLADRERRGFVRRRLWIGPVGDDGTAPIEGRLDAVGAAHLNAALDPLSRPSGEDDTRDYAQRRADALVTLARQALDAGGLPQTAAQRPHVILVTTPDALHDTPGADPSHLDGVGPVSSETARQVCCDAAVTTVVTGRNGEVLDVGREHRDPSSRQRVAVIARDRGCVGCSAPAARCQVHHIVWWHRDQGRTDLDNLCLLCWSCHHDVHHNGWSVQRQANGSYTAAPSDGRRPDWQQDADVPSDARGSPT